MTFRPLTIVALFLLAIGPAALPALAGQTVTTPLLRVADPAGTGRGSVQAKLKGQGSSVTIRVLKLGTDVVAPLGVFLENAPESGVYAEVATIDVLKKGSGKITLVSSDGPPDVLGVDTLDDLADRRLQVRDANDAPLLDAVLPGLVPFAGTKLVANLAPPDGAPAPAASAALTSKLSKGKGSERFQLKAKKLPVGVTAAVFIEDGPNSGNLVPAGDMVGVLFKRDTALGDRLPLDVAAHADLVGRAIEVRDGATVLLAGTIKEKGAPAVTFPLTGVIILDAAPDGDDRYLRVVGSNGPLYRTIVDLTQVSPQDLADTGEALWRIDKIGQTANGPLVTVTLQDHDDTFWISAITGGTHYIHVQKQSVDPAGFDYAHFILRMGSPVGGKPSFLIESAYYAGEFLEDDGHILTANGVKLGPGAATFVLH